MLVVDDQADTRDFITTILEQYQAEVQAVASVKEALQVITQWKPDVLGIFRGQTSLTQLYWGWGDLRQTKMLTEPYWQSNDSP